jgi:hypothetical protein
MNGLEPTAMGLGLAALLLVFLVTKEILIPKVKSKRDESMPRDPHFYCQAGKFEHRISVLEKECDTNRSNLHRLESKIDKTIESTAKIQTDVAVVRQIVSWMK